MTAVSLWRRLSARETCSNADARAGRLMVNAFVRTQCVRACLFARAQPFVCTYMQEHSSPIIVDAVAAAAAAAAVIVIIIRLAGWRWRWQQMTGVHAKCARDSLMRRSALGTPSARACVCVCVLMCECVIYVIVIDSKSQPDACVRVRLHV